MPVCANTITTSSQVAATKPGGAHIPNSIAMEMRLRRQKQTMTVKVKSEEKEEKEDKDNA